MAVKKCHLHDDKWLSEHKCYNFFCKKFDHCEEKAGCAICSTACGKFYKCDSCEHYEYVPEKISDVPKEDLVTKKKNRWQEMKKHIITKNQ